jgi:hypothetical protein
MEARVNAEPEVKPVPVPMATEVTTEPAPFAIIVAAKVPSVVPIATIVPVTALSDEPDRLVGRSRGNAHGGGAGLRRQWRATRPPARVAQLLGTS